MHIPFTCPHCGRHTDVDERFAGQSGACADCGLPIAVPPLQQVQAGIHRRELLRRENLGLLITALVAILSTTTITVYGFIHYLQPSLAQFRQSNQVRICQNNLQQIAQALLAYEADYGELPPPVTYDAQGKPMHSWRVLILPYLSGDVQAIYSNYNMALPWDDPANMQATQNAPDVFTCPADTGIVLAETSYFLVVGPGTLFDGTNPRSTTRAQQGDGLDQTLLLVESHGAGVAWAEPVDLDIVQLARGINSATIRTVRSRHHNATEVATCDGKVLSLPDTFNGSQLRAMATVNGGETIKSLDPYRQPGR